jgi:hypothetical protein
MSNDIQIEVRMVPKEKRVPSDMFDKLSYDMQALVCGLGSAFLYELMPDVAEAAETDERGIEGLVIALLNNGSIEIVKSADTAGKVVLN